MEDNKVITAEQISATIERINNLAGLRGEIERKKHAVEVHERDLKSIEKINGVDSNEWKIKNDILTSAKKELEETENKVSELSFTKSELKPILDELTKQFENQLRGDQEREYHIEIGTEYADGKKTGKKAFKQLMNYLYKNVKWTAQTAPGLMVLVNNMEENKPWVHSQEFDNTIILRSSNVLVLYKNILEGMEGQGYYEAKEFLECWANCGKGITEAAREISKAHETTRNTGSQLNTIEEEFERSENDLPVEDDVVTTKEEVSPQV